MCASRGSRRGFVGAAAAADRSLRRLVVSQEMIHKDAHETRTRAQELKYRVTEPITGLGAGDAFKRSERSKSARTSMMEEVGKVGMDGGAIMLA